MVHVSVVLTFDDGNKSDIKVVAPLLKRYNFGATFFVNKDGGILKSTQKYLVWEEIKELSDLGFEIGNHTGNHIVFKGNKMSTRRHFAKELEIIEQKCIEYNIPLPKSFCYCGHWHTKAMMRTLQRKGYLYARCGATLQNTIPNSGCRGTLYNIKRHHPLLIPAAGIAGPDWTFDDFVWAIKCATGSTVPVFCFHGVPDPHPHVSIDIDLFEKCMDYLYTNDCKVMAMQDLQEVLDRKGI